jgi:hypothetical protein
MLLVQGTDVHPLHDYMLNVPCISRWGAYILWHARARPAAIADCTLLKNTDKTLRLIAQLLIDCIDYFAEWHPFTCAGRSAGGKGGHSQKVTFNIKRYGTFTEVRCGSPTSNSL